MKQHFTITLSAFFGALVGAFVALMLGQRKEAQPIAVTPQPEAAAVPTRSSRKLEEIAPTFKRLSTKYGNDEELYEDHRKAWLRFVREAVQPNMTELEAQEVREAILEYEPPAYNWFEPLFPSNEKPDEGEDLP